MITHTSSIPATERVKGRTHVTALLGDRPILYHRSSRWHPDRDTRSEYFQRHLQRWSRTSGDRRRHHRPGAGRCTAVASRRSGPPRGVTSGSRSARLPQPGRPHIGHAWRSLAFFGRLVEVRGRPARRDHRSGAVRHRSGERSGRPGCGDREDTLRGRCQSTRSRPVARPITRAQPDDRLEVAYRTRPAEDRKLRSAVPVCSPSGRVRRILRQASQ
uniref:Outer-membrane protein n=1 Tax=Rhodococcus opacus TaxID=37919 RepID=Q0PES6_RHOOP|nr:outer-membrane protein [Rhodococcus sp. NCIMB 12038]ABH01037.1 outer-membrane protein [Rhodococcus opacus]